MMTAAELFARLVAWSPIDRENRSDGLVLGDPDRKVLRVAVSLLATPRVIEAAVAGGADLLLVHEPVLHGGAVAADDPYMAKKREMLEKSGLSVYRFHDHSHFTRTDKINTGVLRRLGWEGEFDGQKLFTFKTPRPLASVIAEIRERLGLTHLRYVGAPDITVGTVACLFGAWGESNVYRYFRHPGVDLVLAGEAIEYAICEYVRDAAELGARRGLLLLGHMGSERAGMEYVADHIRSEMGVDAFYLDCGETHSL